MLIRTAVNCYQWYRFNIIKSVLIYHIINNADFCQAQYYLCQFLKLYIITILSMSIYKAVYYNNTIMLIRTEYNMQLFHNVLIKFFTINTDRHLAR